MLTLERWRRRSIYSLGGEGIHGPRPFTMRRQGRPDVRAGRAGCPGFQATPDVRAGGPDVRAGAVAFVALGFGGARFLGYRGRMSGACSLLRLGCCRGRRSRGRMSGALAGCPGPGRCSWLLPLVLLIRGLGDLYIFMRIFGRALLVPNHAQHLGLR